MFLKLCLIIISFQLISATRCPLFKQYSTTERTQIKDFDNFNQLNFTDCKNHYFETKFLEIMPSKELILDSSLNLTGLQIFPDEIFVDLLIRFFIIF
jgi:hypothetical protein